MGIFKKSEKLTWSEKQSRKISKAKTKRNYPTASDSLYRGGKPPKKKK